VKIGRFTTDFDLAYTKLSISKFYEKDSDYSVAFYNLDNSCSFGTKLSEKKLTGATSHATTAAGKYSDAEWFWVLCCGIFPQLSYGK
jgi:hypothetical protein